LVPDSPPAGISDSNLLMDPEPNLQMFSDPAGSLSGSRCPKWILNLI
jgi:hypothetical protein